MIAAALAWRATGAQDGRAHRLAAGRRGGVAGHPAPRMPAPGAVRAPPAAGRAAHRPALRGADAGRRVRRHAARPRPRSSPSPRSAWPALASSALLSRALRRHEPWAQHRGARAAAFRGAAGRLVHRRCGDALDLQPGLRLPRRRHARRDGRGRHRRHAAAADAGEPAVHRHRLADAAAGHRLAGPARRGAAAAAPGAVRRRHGRGHGGLLRRAVAGARLGLRGAAAQAVRAARQPAAAVGRAVPA